jgi:hypothetical protein
MAVTAIESARHQLYYVFQGEINAGDKGAPRKTVRAESEKQKDGALYSCSMPESKNFGLCYAVSCFPDCWDWVTHFA